MINNSTSWPGTTQSDMILFCLSNLRDIMPVTCTCFVLSSSRDPSVDGILGFRVGRVLNRGRSDIIVQAISIQVPSDRVSATGTQIRAELDTHHSYMCYLTIVLLRTRTQYMVLIYYRCESVRESVPVLATNQLRDSDSTAL